MQANFKYAIYASSLERFNEWQGSRYQPLKLASSLDQFLDQPYKIIIVDAFCDREEYVHAYDPVLANFDWSTVDLVLIKETLWDESSKIIKEFVQKNNIKNYLISSHSINDDKNLFVPYWFLRPLNYGTMEELEYKSRKYLFDVLLGYPRPHRFFVLGKLLQNKEILDRSVVTFRKQFLFQDENFEELYNRLDKRIKDLFVGPIIYPYTNNMDDSWENAGVEELVRGYFLNGYDIPWRVYQNTWYSICTETNVPERDPYNQIPRITEKVGRLFLAKRIFIMFGHRGNLKFLNELGFMTFGSIIDESYDLESDPIIRYEKAFEQAKKLATYDPVQIYEQTENIRQHNFKRMFEYKDEIGNRANELLLKAIPAQFCS